MRRQLLTTAASVYVRACVSLCVCAIPRNVRKEVKSMFRDSSFLFTCRFSLNLKQHLKSNENIRMYKYYYNCFYKSLPKIMRHVINRWDILIDHVLHFKWVIFLNDLCNWLYCQIRLLINDDFLCTLLAPKTLKICFFYFDLCIKLNLLKSRLWILKIFLKIFEFRALF